MIMKVIITLYIEDKDWVDEEQAIADLQATDEPDLWAAAHAINYEYKAVE
jgi:predicted nucleic acid-binding protein